MKYILYRNKRFSFEKMSRLTFLHIFFAILLSGCANNKDIDGSLYMRLQHFDSTVRIRAILETVDSGDETVVPLLVDRLTDTNSNVRSLANKALREITNQNFGWSPWASTRPRQTAVDKWRIWLGTRSKLK